MVVDFQSSSIGLPMEYCESLHPWWKAPHGVAPSIATISLGEFFEAHVPKTPLLGPRA